MKNTILKSAVLFFGGLAVFLGACREEVEMIPIPMTVQFEQNLSAYNIFQGDPGELVPANDYTLLELNSTLFSNYSEKQRLVKLPTGSQMTETGNGLPSFPDGTILVKTFFYPIDERDETLGRQVVETRLLIKAEGQWNVGTYIWNDAQTEASLELNGFDKQVEWINLQGASRTIDYHFPDQDECAACHQQNAQVLPIGPALRNLNIEVTRDNFTINQLVHLQDNGLLTDFDVSQIGQLPDYKDASLSLSERGRAYMDMNCAHCHNPGGWSEAASQRVDFRFETSLEDSRILNNVDEITRLVREGEMPYLGNTVVDDEGVDLIIQYVNSL
ncbi:MAG TPA: hypothetical protein DCE41_24145 [Cytophagales bacterium]|nr:hypothetical protein [Cytophagales bacterium]